MQTLDVWKEFGNIGNAQLRGLWTHYFDGGGGFELLEMVAVSCEE